MNQAKQNVAMDSFTKDYWLNLPKAFGNVSESVGDNSAIYLIPTQIFGQKHGLQFWETMTIAKLDNKVVPYVYTF